MLDNMRRLHLRGAANRGVCVDADGAMLGPECVLVRRTPLGYRALERGEAAMIQKSALGFNCGQDWLFHQCQYIADALNRGEIALAQIYGLRIPIGHLDDRHLSRIASTHLTKTGFNPDEPRIPKGDRRGGEWTTGGDAGNSGAAIAAPASDALVSELAAGDVDGSASPVTASSATLASEGPPPGEGAGNGQPPASDSPPIKWEMKQLDDAVAGDLPPAATIAVADTAAGSLLGPISLEAVAGLTQLVARMSGSILFLRILFIPANGSPVSAGAVAGAPNLSTSYDRDTGIIQVWLTDGARGRALLDTGHIGLDGIFYDANGAAIGRALSNGAIVDPDTLPGYRSQSVLIPRPRFCRRHSPTGRRNRSCALIPDRINREPGRRISNISNTSVPWSTVGRCPRDWQ